MNIHLFKYISEHTMHILYMGISILFIKSFDRSLVTSTLISMQKLIPEAVKNFFYVPNFSTSNFFTLFFFLSLIAGIFEIWAYFVPILVSKFQNHSITNKQNFNILVKNIAFNLGILQANILVWFLALTVSDTHDIFELALAVLTEFNIFSKALICCSFIFLILALSIFILSFGLIGTEKEKN